MSRPPAPSTTKGLGRNALAQYFNSCFPRRCKIIRASLKFTHEGGCMDRRSIWLAVLSAVVFVPSLFGNVSAQNSATVLSGIELTRVVPPGFYFQGLSAPTQIRNSAAARFGNKRYVIVGMVDTAGYAADVRAKYE